MIGCSSAESPSSSVQVEALEAPVAPGSGQPRLYTGPEETVWMSWVEPTADDEHALRFATLSDTTWSEPQTVASGADWFVNWADLPSVRPLSDGRIAAHYLASNGSSALAYEVRITQTGADGRWQEAVVPHQDGTETEHGFVSLLPWHSNRLLAVWLDGRNMAGSGGGHGGGEMTLRSAVLDSTGTVDRRHEVDGRTCECCATSAVRVDGDALVAYRDRSDDELRDIRVTRFDGDQWSSPTLVHADEWQIEGCPVNGPALAAEGDRVAAAWFTAADDRPRVQVAFSSDGGRTFTEPSPVVEGETQGRVDAVLLDDGGGAVSWLEQMEEGGAVRLRTVGPDGAPGPATTVARLPSTARQVGFPKMVRQGGHLYLAWVGMPGEESGQTRVQTARMTTEDIR